VEELDKKWHEERSSHLHYKEIAELYGQQRDALAQPIRHELEVWLCPVHASLDEDGLLASLDKCVACIRVERDELRAELRAVHAGKDSKETALKVAIRNLVEANQRLSEQVTAKDARIAELERLLAEARREGSR
jgi:hypothetical protein